MGLNVVLLGYGAIGRALHRELLNHTDRVAVVGVLDRASLGHAAQEHASAGTGRPAEGAGQRPPVLGLADALDRAAVIAECASPAAGTDLLIASLGALVDEPLRRGLDRGPGRAYFSTGAIGGLDLIRASAGSLTSVKLHTRKAPAALLHAGLDPAQRAAIAAAAASGEPRTVFRGSVARAVQLFPSNINVAAALGLAAGDLDLVEVAITADPAAARTSHEIHVEGSGGSYRFAIENAPDPANPATSALTARAMASGLLRLAGLGPHFI